MKKKLKAEDAEAISEKLQKEQVEAAENIAKHQAEIAKDLEKLQDQELLIDLDKLNREDG